MYNSIPECFNHFGNIPWSKPLSIRREVDWSRCDLLSEIIQKKGPPRPYIWCFRHCVYLQSNACVCKNICSMCVYIYIHTYSGGTYNIYNRCRCIIAWISHMFGEQDTNFQSRTETRAFTCGLRFDSASWFAFPTWKRWMQTGNEKHSAVVDPPWQINSLLKSMGFQELCCDIPWSSSHGRYNDMAFINIIFFVH